MSSFKWVVNPREWLDAKVVKAVEVAASHLATQWSNVHPGSTKEQTFSAHIEVQPTESGASAQVVIDSDILGYIVYGTGIFGLPETAPHRVTPWVYYDDREMGFRTTWGTHPHPDYKEAFDAAYEAMINLSKDVFAGDL